MGSFCIIYREEINRREGKIEGELRVRINRCETTRKGLMKAGLPRPLWSWNSRFWFPALTFFVSKLFRKMKPDTSLRCPGTLFISHEHAIFLFSVFRVVQGEAKTPKIMGCCRAIFAFLHALKIGTFRGK